VFRCMSSMPVALLFRKPRHKSATGKALNKMFMDIRRFENVLKS
jgi:hypothetical protein